MLTDSEADTEAARLPGALANDSTANTKLSKTQLSKMYQLQGFIFPYMLDIALGKITSKAITMHLVENNKYLPQLEKNIPKLLLHSF